MSELTTRVATALFLVVAAGCATPYNLHTRVNGSSGELSGRRIAVLPAISIGAEHGPALIGDRAAERVFEDEIGGFRFVSPANLTGALATSPELLPQLRRELRSRLPANLATDGKGEKIFEDDEAAAVKLPNKIAVNLHRGPASTDLSPEALPANWFAAIDADYVLVSAQYAAYRQENAWYAIFGVIPYGWSRQLASTGPRGVFSLYEVASGRRVWEAFVALELLHTGPNAVVAPVDPRVMPLSTAVYLLTGDLETPLGRSARGATPED